MNILELKYLKLIFFNLYKSQMFYFLKIKLDIQKRDSDIVKELAIIIDFLRAI